MIKATCIPCGTDLGSFRDREEYLAWRSQTGDCPNCGASLDTSLFTSYVKVEHPVGEHSAIVEQAGDEQGRETEVTGQAREGAANDVAQETGDRMEEVTKDATAEPLGTETEQAKTDAAETGEASNTLRNFLRRGR